MSELLVSSTFIVEQSAVVGESDGARGRTPPTSEQDVTHIYAMDRTPGLQATAWNDTSRERSAVCEVRSVSRDLPVSCSREVNIVGWLGRRASEDVWPGTASLGVCRSGYGARVPFPHRLPPSRRAPPAE
ncbi:unnamed protein product [Leptosia nina]|uniref:Uncharacterized protein n=1 Tax=Leptosia nina TaxID=320188 RepID=A0AAV1J6E1_9NEOP